MTHKYKTNCRDKKNYFRTQKKTDGESVFFFLTKIIIINYGLRSVN